MFTLIAFIMWAYVCLGVTLGVGLLVESKYKPHAPLEWMFWIALIFIWPKWFRYFLSSPKEK